MASLNETRIARQHLLQILAGQAGVKRIALGVAQHHHQVEVVLQPGRAPEASWPHDINGVPVVYRSA